MDEDSQFVDIDDNSTDFLLSDDPHPQLTLVPNDEDSDDTTDEDELEGDNETDSEAPDNDDDQHEDDETDEDAEQDEEIKDDNEDEANTAYHSVIISELFVDPEQPLTDADDEFVEVFNPHDTPVDLSGYTIQAGSKLQYTHELDDVVLAPGEYKAFTSRVTGLKLANTGGRAQVLDPGGGIATSLVSYPEAETGESYARINNDFLWTDNVTPSAANQSPTPETQDRSSSTQGPSTAASSPKNQQSYPRVVLNEFLPDPAPPQTDSNDEFVELYNPHDTAVAVSGYTIRSGSRGTTTHTIADTTIEPGGYVALFSSDSNLTLSNSGITVTLEDPNGEVLDTQNYPEAEEGSSWAKTEDGEWQWTTSPSPAASNTFTQEESGDAESGVTVTSGETGEGSVLDAAAQPAAVDATQADYRIIGGAVVLALLYGVYEFRYDIYAYFHKFREYLSNR